MWNSLKRIYSETKKKYQKGSASPKLGYMTIQSLIDREDYDVRFMYVRRYEHIYTLIDAKHGVATLRDEDGNITTTTNLDSKIIMI